MRNLFGIDAGVEDGHGAAEAVAQEGEAAPAKVARQPLDGRQAVEEVVRHVGRVVVGQAVAGQVDADDAQVRRQQRHQRVERARVVQPAVHGEHRLAVGRAPDLG